MRIKVVALVVYLFFVGVAAYEWRSISSSIARQEQAIAAWQRLDARIKSGVVALERPAEYLRAYQGFAQESIATGIHQRKFILISGVLTLPLALLLGGSLKRTKA